MNSAVQQQAKPVTETGLLDVEDLERDFEKHKEVTMPEKLQKAKLNPNEEIVEEQFLLYADGVGCATVGNIVTLIGKAKSKKSMLLATWVSALLGGNSFNKFRAGENQGRKPKGAYFDTEQSKRHCQFQYRRIGKLTGRKLSSCFDYYMLRPNDPKERVKMIEEAIYSNPDYTFVVIDGIADLLSKGVNDEEEAIHITNLLMKWSLERNINIITVLHQNKGDSNAKGHIGSQLVQKSETVFSVEKDPQQKEISTVSSPFARGMEIEPFHFSLDDEGVPFVVEGFENSEKRASKSKNPFDYEKEVHYSILSEVFSKSKDLKYSDLQEKIKYVLGTYSISIGDNKCRDWCTYYREQEMITQEGQMKPYRLGIGVR